MENFNLNDYISFEPFDSNYVSGTDITAPSYDSFNYPNGVQPLTDQAQSAIQSALNDIAKTPEGRKLIIDAAESSPTGKAHISSNPGGQTMAVDGSFSIGTLDGFAAYKGIDGEYHDLSIQRVLVHELHHLAENHLDVEKRLADDEIGAHTVRDGRIVEYENDAVDYTNDFMKKYYGEVPRADYFDPEDIAPNFESPNWDNAGPISTPLGRGLRDLFNPTSFNAQENIHTDIPKRSIDTGIPEDLLDKGDTYAEVDLDYLRADINQLSVDQAASLGPEIHTLKELVNSPERFEEAVQDFSGTSNFHASLLKVSSMSMDNQSEILTAGQQHSEIAISKATVSQTFG